MSSIGAFFQVLCCGTTRRRGKVVTPDSCKVRIRIGFDGKDMLLDPNNVNVKKTFGSFSVLLDDRNQLVPLRSDGSAVEPLEVHRRYTVVVNTHGSSKFKWDDLRQKGKHKHKHKSRHSSSKKKKCSNGSGSGGVKGSSSMKDVLDMGAYEKTSENGCDEYIKSTEPLISKNATQPTSFAAIDFGVASSQEMLIPAVEDMLIPTVDDMLSMNMNMSMNINSRTEYVM